MEWPVPRTAATSHAAYVAGASKREIHKRDVRQEAKEQDGKRFMQKMEET
jgi:hypothetical protein